MSSIAGEATIKKLPFIFLDMAFQSNSWETTVHSSLLKNSVDLQKQKASSTHLLLCIILNLMAMQGHFSNVLSIKGKITERWLVEREGIFS